MSDLEFYLLAQAIFAGLMAAGYLFAHWFKNAS